VGLRRRLERLEEVNTIGKEPAIEPPDLEERRARLREDLEHAREKAEREAAAGDSRRLRAIEDLERRMRERAEQRRARELEKGA
jgi:hypothetical protein